MALKARLSAPRYWSSQDGRGPRRAGLRQRDPGRGGDLVGLPAGQPTPATKAARQPDCTSACPIRATAASPPWQ